MRTSVQQSRAARTAAAASNKKQRVSRDALAHTTANRVRGQTPTSDPAPKKRYKHKSEAYKDRPDPTKAVFELVKSGRVRGVKM